jgi:transposase
MKGLTLTNKEQNRLSIMNGVLQRQWAVSEAAEILGLSERHTWRLLAAYRKEGAAALAHGNRGRPPINVTSQAVQTQVIALARDRYQGVNHTHFTELLAEREGIVAFPIHGEAPAAWHRTAQCSAPSATVSSLSAGAHAPGRNAGTNRRQPPPLVGAKWSLADLALSRR